jgi:hypothetical protein
MDGPKLGPTGDFPQGKLSADDQGGLNVALSHHVAPDGTVMVRMDFGTPVAWLSLPQEMAIEFALSILKHTGVRTVQITHGGGDASNLEGRGQGD